MDSENNMPGVNGEIKKDGVETVDEKRDLGAKPKKVDDKSSKTRRTSEVPSLDAERQCLVQRPTDQQWRKSMFFFVLHYMLDDFSNLQFTFSVDAAEIIHVRPVENGKTEYYVHYHGCKCY